MSTGAPLLRLARERRHLLDGSCTALQGPGETGQKGFLPARCGRWWLVKELPTRMPCRTETRRHPVLPEGCITKRHLHPVPYLGTDRGIGDREEAVWWEKPGSTQGELTLLHNPKDFRDSPVLGFDLNPATKSVRGASIWQSLQDNMHPRITESGP